MTDDNETSSEPIAGFTTDGGTYRATTTGGGDTWLCPHVHFTPQSARTCADRHVTKLATAAARPA